MVSGAALKKLIIERLPQKILDQMHVVDLTGKTDNTIITIITNPGRTAEKWEAARKNLGLKASFKTFSRSKQSKYEEASERPERKSSKRDRIRKSERKHKKDKYGDKVRKNQSRSNFDSTKTEGIDPSELSRRRAAGECLRCAWPSDRKGTHGVKDCKRPIKLDPGTASLPKAKEYQKMQIAGIELPSDDDDSECSESDERSDDSESSANSEEEYLDNSDEELEQEPQEEGNWWDSPESSD